MSGKKSSSLVIFFFSKICKGEEEKVLNYVVRSGQLQISFTQTGSHCDKIAMHDILLPYLSCSKPKGQINTVYVCDVCFSVGHCGICIPPVTHVSVPHQTMLQWTEVRTNNTVHPSILQFGIFFYYGILENV